MGIVRGEKDHVFADAVEHVGQGGLLRFGGEKPVAAGHVLARLGLEQRGFGLPFLPLLVHAIHPVGHPARAAFKKSDAQFGKFFRHAAVHQRGAVDQSFNRPADRMLEEKRIVANLARRPLAGVVHEQRRVQPLKLLVNGPEFRFAQMLFHTEGSDRNAGEAELRDRAIGFCNRGGDILKGRQADALEARAFLAVLGDPVVVGAAIGRSVVLLGEPRHMKGAGREQHRRVDGFLVHVAQARRHIRHSHPELAVHARIPLVVGQ